jgi:hypothetical protein
VASHFLSPATKSNQKTPPQASLPFGCPSLVNLDSVGVSLSVVLALLRPGRLDSPSWLISPQIAIPGDLPLSYSQVSANWKGGKVKIKKNIKRRSKNRQAFTLYEI